MPRIRAAAPVTHQAACRGKVAILENCRHRMAKRQCGELFAPTDKESVGDDQQRAGLKSRQFGKDRFDVAYGTRMQDMELQPELTGCDLQFFGLSLGSRGSAGFTRCAMILAEGTTSCTSSSRFGANTTPNVVTPVRLPAGLFKLATNPSLTGSSPVKKTIGMVVVAAFAANACELRRRRSRLPDDEPARPPSQGTHHCLPPKDS